MWCSSDFKVLKPLLSLLQDDEDIEAQIDRELAEDEKRAREADDGLGERVTDDDGEEERWPTPMEPLEGAFDSDSEYFNMILLSFELCYLLLHCV